MGCVAPEQVSKAKEIDLPPQASRCATHAASYRHGHGIDHES